MGGGARRYEWIDLLRGIAVVGMIWTHAANTFLEASIQATRGYHELSFYHGLVSPVFFWVAGYMRGLAAAKPGPCKPAWPTVRRLLMILGTGYLLHVPWLALMHGDFSAPVLRILFQSDVLHCLALSCLVLLALERGVARDLLPWLAAALGLVVVLVTPALASATSGFIPLDAFLAKSHGSLFPLFPWLGFACAGFVVGCTGMVSWRLAGVSAVAAFGLPWLPGASSTFTFFFERLGWVTMSAVLVMKGCSLLLRRGVGLPRWLLLAGRESLCVYVVHLIFIYSVPWWRGTALNYLIGATQPPGMVAVIFVGLLLASLGVAWGNERRKQRRFQPSPSSSTWPSSRPR